MQLLQLLIGLVNLLQRVQTSHSDKSSVEAHVAPLVELWQTLK